MRSRKLGLASAVVLATIYASWRAEAQTIRVCIGQYAERCGAHDLHVPCGSNIDTVAQDTCTVRGPNERRLEYSLVLGSTRGGNRCGYANYLLVCRDTPR